MSAHITVHTSSFATKRSIEVDFDKADHSKTAWLRFEVRQWENGEANGSDQATFFVDNMTKAEVDLMVAQQRAALRKMKKWNDERAGA